MEWGKETVALNMDDLNEENVFRERTKKQEKAEGE